MKVIKESLLNMADSMAAAAVSFNSHGYDNFIMARETFLSELENVFESKVVKKENPADQSKEF